MVNDVSDIKAVCPPGLKFGDTVAVIAPASQFKPGQESDLERGLQWLRDQGWKPRLMSFASARHRSLPYLAGDDEERVADVHEAFSAPEVKAVWCIRGGYGTPRILEGLDFELIAANPKVFIGFSDITAIHVVLNQKLGWVTFHGPMISSNLGREVWQSSEWAKESLLRCVCAGRGAPGSVSQGDESKMGKTIVEGVAEGMTIGGNGTLIGSLLGTPFGLDDTPGRILLIEEVDEAVYRIDRLLTQLRLALKLQGVAGVAIGQVTGLDEKDQAIFEDMLRDRLEDLNKPVVTGLPFGHEDPAACLPLGAWGRLVANSDGRGDLIFNEPAVS